MNNVREDVLKAKVNYFYYAVINLCVLGALIFASYILSESHTFIGAAEMLFYEYLWIYLVLIVIQVLHILSCSEVSLDDDSVTFFSALFGFKKSQFLYEEIEFMYLYVRPYTKVLKIKNKNGDEDKVLLHCLLGGNQLLERLSERSGVSIMDV